MTALISAEATKLRTVRSTWSVLLVLPLVAVVSLFDAVFDPVEHNSVLVDFMDVSLTVVAIIVAAFAAVNVGGEFLRRTVGLDYLTVPRRVPVLAAKMAAFAYAGALLGLATGAVAHAVVIPIALGRDVPPDGIGQIVARIATVAVATALLGALGAAIGVLVPHPAIAVGAIIGWQLVEGVLGAALGIAPYLPISLLTSAAHLGGTVSLPAAFGLLASYAALVGAAAMLVGRRRDLN
ncbi:hypothetical protein [Glycomyces xiaoerkulensis]|uniref:hypothetical protein n=1 Tax=Glycomyces xiaoerkulensis TaxID=2038139 RepID=UPI000C25DFAC|nr:hypothetical protein [Glycomyces xiaoerkulensis]